MSIKVRLNDEIIDVNLNMGQTLMTEDVSLHNISGTSHNDIRNSILAKANTDLSNVSDTDFLNKAVSAIPGIDHNHADSANANLIINSGFQVWQRGTSFTNPNNAYTADRFRCNGTGTVSKVSDGMKITGTINVKYVMEDVDFAKITGKEVTLSYSRDGIITTKTFTASGSGHVTVLDLNITNQTLSWVKLELGDTATPYQPRPYAEELILCQRYYFVFDAGTGNGGFFPAGTNSAGTAGVVLIPTSVPLRVVPTLINSVWNEIQIRQNGNIHYVTGITGTPVLRDTGVTYNFTTGTAMQGNSAAFCLSGGTVQKALDAEVY